MRYTVTILVDYSALGMTGLFSEKPVENITKDVEAPDRSTAAFLAGQLSAESGAVMFSLVSVEASTNKGGHLIGERWYIG